MAEQSESIAQLTGVTKTFGEGEAEVHALRGVDLTLHAGEVVVILGPSGSGKTTLLNIVGGIEAATSGEVSIGGTALVGMGFEELATIRRENVSFIFQFFNLIQTLTAAENVQVIAELTERVDRADLDGRVASVISDVDLTDRADHFPGQMSGGQQQRVAIARALVTGPKLLLCDEPTGALDLDTGRTVLALLQRTARDDQRCVVIVTHNQGIAVMADRVLRVHDGSIADETVQEAGSAQDVNW
ncbi:MAG: ABC transporter ATP-binding protein [Actinomycetota bacterium]|nr:ABC transporter ATP-binding protein [Actinomycetota bacterium]MDH4016873.1 ABC transporter ATP-binding protein [Actinomycetota bacterium]